MHRFVLIFCLLLMAARAADRPNILFLLSDDHSYPYLGCYGNPDIRTPNIDRLAQEGLRFDRMFVGCPQCVPSRASLMTGQSAVAVQMVRFTSALRASTPVLPEILHNEAGYFTGVSGRTYHLDGPPTDGPRGAKEIGGTMDRFHLRVFKERVDFVELPGAHGGMVDFGGKFKRFLDAAPKGKPWFFWLGFSDPHHPWDTKGKQGLLDPKKLTLPGHLPDLPGVRQDLANYMEEIEHCDGDVQDVLDVLAARGLAQNTVVVFMGDNGMALPHGKGALQDPGLAVPLIIRWPGVVKPGGATKALVSGEDFAPTMLAIAGVKAPSVMSGVSYLPLLKGEPFTPRKYIFAERGPHGGDGTMKPDILAATFDLARCIRSDHFKLIYNCTPHQAVAPVDSQGNPGWQQIKAAHAAGNLAPQFERAYFTLPRSTFELYDLDADPFELTNLDGNPKYKDVEHELKRALTEKMVLDWDFLPTPLK